MKSQIHWATKKVKETVNINKRDIAHTKWRKSHTEKDRAKYLTLHSQATVHQAHKEYSETLT